MKKLVLLLVLLGVLAGILMIPVGGTTEEEIMVNETKTVKAVDLSGYSDEAPGEALNLLFIHHSCGGQWLAEPGEDVGEACIYESHPNGGGLRKRLQAEGYGVFEASYKSKVGDKTDWHHWREKFTGMMDEILACAMQDLPHEGGKTNDIVMFKSCFPNNRFLSEGRAPGNADGEKLTVWNAKAAYSSLLPEFAKHPEVLFVLVTAPPLAGKLPPEPLWKALARKVTGKKRGALTHLVETGVLARGFNNWLKAEDGWLSDYAANNVVVFDYYDILTGDGRSNLSLHASRGGYNNHPSREGNSKAAEAFPSFLNRAVRRAGLVSGAGTGE